MSNAFGDLRGEDLRGSNAMDMETFLDLCDQYNQLGWAVQEQLKGLDMSLPAEDLNPNALGMIANFLQYAERRGVLGTDLILQAIAEAKFEGG